MSVSLADVDVYNPDNFVPSVPYEMFDVLRREAPVSFHPEPDGPGFWNVTRHADIVTVSRDNETFSSEIGGTNIPDFAKAELATQRLMLVNMDPPKHTRYRLIVNKAFTPVMIRKINERLQEITTSIVDDIIERRDLDFIADVACELPLQAIAEILGVPHDDRKIVFDLSNRLIGFDDPEFQTSMEDAHQAAFEMWRYANDLAQDRRANPRDDIITKLVTAEVDGEGLSDMDFNMFFLMLSVAGNETTRTAISHGFLAMSQHPDQWQIVVDDPSEATINSAAEEILRWATPVHHFRRTATRDTVLAGQEIKEGDKVVLWYPSGNRDDAVFADPYTFDVRRQPNEHVAFGGGGAHFCLGAGLARTEIRLMFRELATRVPEFEITGDVPRLRSNFVNGLKRMPVTFASPRT